MQDEEFGFPSQLLRDVPGSMHRRMRPDMLLVETHTSDDILPTLRDLEHPRHRRNHRIHVVDVGSHRRDFAQRQHMLRNTKKHMSSIKVC